MHLSGGIHFIYPRKTFNGLSIEDAGLSDAENPIRKRGTAASDDVSIGQTLQVSFSAVSKPNFARKYALESSRRDLHNALLCTVLESNPFSMLKIVFKNR